MRTKAFVIAPLLGLVLLTAGCITDVCRINSGQVELKVQFSGFDPNAAETLVVESTIRGPHPGDVNGPYFDRRIGTLRFADTVGGNSETFVLDPGAYIYGLRDANQFFSWEIVMRVYDSAGKMLAEGRHVLDGVKTNGCFLARKMTVSNTQTCDHKAEGDPCVSDSNEPWVCMGSGGGLSCTESTCGDGFVDRRNGELCDPQAPLDNVQCHATDCLPAPVERVLIDGLMQWRELNLGSGPSRRVNAAVAVAGSGGAQRAVLFGGLDASNTPTNDTWIFDGATWTEYPTAPPAGLVPRSDHAMAYDPNAQIIVLYGGKDGSGTLLDDTWTFTQADGWQEVAPTFDGMIVPPLHSHAMAYYPGAGNGVALFGGHDGSTFAADANLLQYTHNPPTWTLLLTDTEARYDHSLTYFPEANGLLVAGGQVAGSTPANVYENTRIYDGALSEADTASVKRISRTAHQAVYSQALGEVVLFGGSSRASSSAQDDFLLRSVQTCDATAGSVSCTKRGSPDVPHRRRGHVMFELDSSLYVFGGVAAVITGEGNLDATPLGDTWQLTLPLEPKSEFVMSQGLMAEFEDDSLIAGLYDLGTGDPNTTDMDRARAMIIDDFDGDGRHELALGLPGAKCPSANTICGRVLLKDHPVGDHQMGEITKDMLTIIGNVSTSGLESWLGSAIAAGDFNADGARDLLIGAPQANSGGGALFVVYGGNQNHIPISADQAVIQIGNTSDRAKFKAFNPAGTETGTMPYRLGAAVAAGDFDGDGFVDAMASAPLENSDAEELSTVYVLAGPGGDWPGGNNPDDITNRAPIIITSDTPELLLGYALAAGDVDGDGYADLLVGSSATANDGAPQFGAVAVIFGGESFFNREDPVINIENLDPSEGVLLAAADPTDRLAGMGTVLTAVDLDSDGAAELVTALGRPNRTLGAPGAVAIFSSADFIAYRAGDLSESALMDGALVFKGPVGSGFGASLSAGDANGDLHEDLIIGAPYQDSRMEPGQEPRPEAGAIYVVLGSPVPNYFAVTDTTVDDLLNIDVATDDVNIPLIIVRGNQSYGFFGTAVATSSHLISMDVETTAGYSFVYQPGWFDGTEPTKRNRGRVWSLNLSTLLGCGNQAPCPLP